MYLGVLCQVTSLIAFSPFFLILKISHKIHHKPKSQNFSLLPMLSQLIDLIPILPHSCCCRFNRNIPNHISTTVVAFKMFFIASLAPTPPFALTALSLTPSKPKISSLEWNKWALARILEQRFSDKIMLKGYLRIFASNFSLYYITEIKLMTNYGVLFLTIYSFTSLHHCHIKMPKFKLYYWITYHDKIAHSCESQLLTQLSSTILHYC